MIEKSGWGFRYSLRFVFGALFVCAVVLATYSWFLNRTNTIRDGYHQYLAGAIVIDFMDNNDGAWPRDWDSIHPQFKKLSAMQSDDAFENFKQRVLIDFRVDLEELRRKSQLSESPTFNVISAKYTKGFYSLENANSMIHRYLKNK